MSTWIERFPQAYQEWVQAGGIENNFRKHALAIGSAQPTRDDAAFMAKEADISVKQLFSVINKVYFNPVILPQTSPATGLAADISYLTGEIDQAFCDMLKSQGVDLVIVGLQEPALANSQLSVLLAAKLKCHAYIWPQNQNLDDYLPQVYELLARYRIPCIWVDVEDSGTNVDAAIAELREHQGFVVGIYTSAYMWKKYMSNTDQYQYLPLWYARYDHKPDMADFEPFAGWDTPSAKQYNADNDRYDLDVYDPNLMP